MKNYHFDRTLRYSVLLVHLYISAQPLNELFIKLCYKNVTALMY